MRATRLLGMGLAILRTTESAKEYSPVVPPAAVKSTFTLVLGVGLSALLGERRPVQVVVEGIAAAGLASLLHDIQDASKRFTDNQIMGVMQHAVARPRQTGPLGGGNG